MINKKSVIIFIGVLLGAYVGAYFYTASLIQNAIVKNLEVEEYKIERSGFPFDITYKVSDHFKLKQASYNLLSKKIQMELNFVPKSVEDFKYKKSNVKKLDHLILSAKLESYFELLSALKGGISEIEAFNLTNDYQIDFKGDTEEPDLSIDAAMRLSFPGKRNFDSLEDIVSDFPRQFAGFIKYNIDSDKKADMPSFVQKIFELTYPENTEIHFEGSSDGVLNFSDDKKSEIIKSLLDLDLNIKAITKTKIIKSEGTVDMGTKGSLYVAEIKAGETYEGDSIKNLYNSLSKEEINEFVLFVLHNMEMQLSDDTKTKITMLTDLAFAQIEKEISKDPKFWDKYHNLRTRYNTSIVVPTNAGDDDATLLIHIPNDSGEFEFKLDGRMKGGLSAEYAKGRLFLSGNGSNNIAEVIGYVRLATFAMNKSIKADHFKNIIDNFEEDAKFISSELKSISDDKDSQGYSYTYSLDMKSPLNSTVNKNGGKVMNLILLLTGLFAVPPMEPLDAPVPVAPVLPQVPAGGLEGANDHVPPADAPEETDL